LKREAVILWGRTHFPANAARPNRYHFKYMRMPGRNLSSIGNNCPGIAVEWKIELALNSIFDVVILIVSYSMLFVLLQSSAIVVISENCVGIRSQTGPNHAIFWAGNSSEAFSP
jgi:hypothetical protein